MIELIILNALYIVGFHLATGEDMILNKPALWIEQRIPYWLTKPLFNCPTCMASVHSIVPYFYINDLTTQNLLIYPFYVCALAGLSTILARQTE